MGRAISTEPASEPITTAEAKAHMRVTISDDDTYIAGLIVAARRHVERRLKRALITQTWDATYPCFQREFELSPGPVQSVTYIKYFDLAGDLQTLDSSVYQLDTMQAVGKVSLGYGQSWPSVRTGLYNSVTIRYVAGFGTADAVPQNIIHPILMLAAHWYEIREPVVVNGSVSNVPETVDALINAERVVEIA